MADIVIDNVRKVFGKVVAVKDLSLTIRDNEFIVLLGPSGCGKSTLLHLLGGLDKPSSGSVTLEGQNMNELDDDHLTELRRRKLGFIFQFYNLIPVLTAVENTALPVTLDGMKPAEAYKKAADWLARFEMQNYLARRPDELSGGQQQRVAIARALVAEPALVLADEPTGNLDTRSSGEIASLLRQVSKEYGRAVIMVTHDPRIAAYADRIVFLKDGKIADETILERRK